MFVLIRAITYASLFIGLVLVYVPSALLEDAGFTRPASLGTPQIVGMIGGGAGAILALWCIFTFAWVGKGTPAPFDPPRRLVTSGPYGYVRNPMYIGAALALGGAALFFHSLALLFYVLCLVVATNLFVFLYEEPILRKTFGAEYEAYCKRVGRWWPRMKHRSA